jgi:ABC transporter substrate binding protein
MAYSIDWSEVVRHIAVAIDKILKGVKPGDIPIYLPTKFDLSINLKAANSLGLTIPPYLLARADEVVEISAPAASWHPRRGPAQRRQHRQAAGARSLLQRNRI